MIIPDNRRLGKLIALVAAKLHDHRNDGVAIHHPHWGGVVKHLVDVRATALEYLSKLTISDALLAYPVADRVNLMHR